MIGAGFTRENSYITLAYSRITHFFASEIAECIRRWERFSPENANAAAQRAVRAEIARAVVIVKAAKAAATRERNKVAAAQRLEEDFANIEFPVKVGNVLELMG